MFQTTINIKDHGALYDIPINSGDIRTSSTKFLDGHLEFRVTHIATNHFITATQQKPHNTSYDHTKNLNQKTTQNNNTRYQWLVLQ